MATRRKKFPRGLTQDAKGWRITVGIGKGEIHRARLGHDLSLDQATEQLVLARKRWGANRRNPGAGTLAADVARYLRDYCTGRPHYEERQRHLELWIAALGTDTPRAGITRDDISRVLHDWRVTLAADTCNKRRTALLALYHALDGRGGSNPVREIAKFRAPAALPRGLAYPDIDRALAQLPVCKTKARLAVLAATGIRAGQLMRLTPDAWKRQERALLVPGTEKGRGTKPYVVPLSTRATRALTELDRLKGWGTFTWAPLARAWKEAWIAAQTGQSRSALRGADLSAIVAPVPYDLRHSFGTAVYQATGDIQAARELLGHSTLRMTERYTLAAVPIRQQAAIRAFNRVAKLPPSTPPSQKSRPKRRRV